MYLATYVLHYWCDGRTADDRYLTADTLDELRQKMAEEHYQAKFDSLDRESSPDDFTDDWRIYEFKEDIDIKKLPEFLTLLDARDQRLAEATKRKAREADDARIRQEQTERETYERLKEKFEGGSPT